MKKLTPYHKKKFRLGGISASILPILLGFGLLLFPIVTQQIGDYLYWIMALPIIISFIFVAPYVAILCVEELRKNSPIQTADIFITSIAKSTKANCWVALVYNAIASIFFLFDGVTTGNFLEVLFFFLVFAALFQFVLWLCVTLPLALICATIFSVIIRPKEKPSSSYSAAASPVSGDHIAGP